MKSGEEDSLGRTGLAFFGKLSAGVAHEIKNKLAILKEESGLISDLFLAAARGRPLDTSRIQELVQKMNLRLDLIDEIVSRLSRFAHSVDETRKTFDLSELLSLEFGLCQRFAAIKKVTLELSPAPYQVQITNNPFLLMHLLYLIIARGLETAAEGGKLTAEVHDSRETAYVSFSGSFTGPLFRQRPAPENLETILGLLGATLVEEENPTRLVVQLAKDLHQL